MICIAENSGGKGGVAGGAGANGQASQHADGAGASDYGYPVLEVTTGMTTSLSVQLTQDTDGTIPADMSGVSTVKFIARPSMYGSPDRQLEVPCTFNEDGLVSLTFTPEIVDNNNGVWYSEFLCYGAGTPPVLLKSFRSYLCIRKGMTGSDRGTDITAMDVRLALMDTSAEANQLLDDLEFSDMMIYNAIERCINEWNETPPELNRRYDATTFPYKEALIKGAVGYLMQAIAYRYTRNRMTYAASGLQLDTSDKGPQYIQLASQARMEWKSFIAAKKTEHNMAECFGVVDMPYFGSRWW